MAKERIYSAEKLVQIIKMYEKKLKKVLIAKEKLVKPIENKVKNNRRLILLKKKEGSEIYLKLKLEYFSSISPN